MIEVRIRCCCRGDVAHLADQEAANEAEDGDGEERLPAWATDAALVSWFEDAGFAFWLPLPDGMQLFFEVQS